MDFSDIPKLPGWIPNPCNHLGNRMRSLVAKNPISPGWENVPGAWQIAGVSPEKREREKGCQGRARQRQIGITDCRASSL